MFEDNIPKILLKDYLKWLTSVDKGEWSWLNNSRCKYVSTTVDTRSDWLIVLDRNGEMLKLSELLYQYEYKGENE